MLEGVRPATPDDLDFLARSARALAAELEPMRGGALWRVRDSHPEPVAASMLALLEGADGCVVVGTIDDEPVGYGALTTAVLRDGSRLATITDLYVEPAAREVGIGDAIIAALVAEARRRDCIGIDATALPGHRSTKNFFEGQGFVARSLTMHHRLT